MKKEHIVRSVMIGAIVASVYVVIATVAGELYKPYKNLLADLHYHHWVGKGIWAAAMFIVISIVSYLSTKNSEDINSARSIKLLSHALVFGTLILTIFFIYEYVIHH